MSQLSARAQLEQRGGRAEILSVKHNLELNDNNTDKKKITSEINTSNNSDKSKFGRRT